MSQRRIIINRSINYYFLNIFANKICRKLLGKVQVRVSVNIVVHLNVINKYTFRSIVYQFESTEVHLNACLSYLAI